MRANERTLGCTLVVLLSAIGVSAVTPSDPASPFQGIAERNVFGLVTPPPIARPVPPAPPLPALTLTGFILGFDFEKPRALFEAIWPAKPPEQPKKLFLTLGEGERDSDIEVLRIDEKAGKVELRINEVVAPLTFAANGAKAAPGSRAPAAHTRSPETTTVPNAPSVQPMSLEEQAILIEAERLRTREATEGGKTPLLPNTLVTREADAAGNAAANAESFNTSTRTRGSSLRRAPSLPRLPQ